MAEEVIGLLFGVDGGGEIDGKSGEQIVKDLTKIVNQINGGKSKVPKIKLKFDVSEAKKAVSDLKRQLKDIEKIASIKVTQNGGKAGQGGTTQNLQKQIEKYQRLSATIKQWVQTSKQGAKLSEEYSTITRESDGTLSGTAEGYEQTVAAINEVNKAMKELRLTFDAEGKPIKPDKEQFAEIAAQIGITEEQYQKLFKQAETGSATVGVNVENAHRKNRQSWTATASKIRDEVQRMYGTIAKDPNAKRLADDIIKYSQSATGNVGELKNKYDQLRNSIHESGADIETWGDKFKKTFAGKVRSALAGAITAAFTKYLREIYQNVVNIDKALVNLQIASGKSREETQRLVKEYAQLGKQLGATTTEVAEAADTWLRQGYSAEEANTLIKNSMMLSKLGQMESTEASTALTSAMKGYGVAVEDSIKIVDKFTKVDMEAAASAGDIATAMAETATSAKLSGVSMDTLIGYLTTVKEVTQDGSESVGVFFKTLFSRMNNVAAGKFVDDETGESLNDVEAVLGKLGIALRGANEEFRNSSDVLGEVASRWNDFNDTERNAIATAMAGARNFEKFNVLMQNYGTAVQYAESAVNSAGNTMEKFEAYTEGVEGKMKSLKATFEELSLIILNSDWLIVGVEFLSGLLDTLNTILSLSDSFIVKTALVVGSIYLAVAAYNKLSVAFKKAKADIIELIAYQTALQATEAASATTTSALTAAIIKYSSTGLLGVITFIPRAIAALIKYGAVLIKQKLILHSTTSAATLFNNTMAAFNINPYVLAITAAVAAITGLIAALGAANTAWKDNYESAKKAADEQRALIEEYDSEIDSLESLQAKLIDAQGNRQKLASIYDELNSKIAVSSGLLQGEGNAYKAVTAQIQDQIEAKKRLREETLKTMIAEERSAFNNNKASSYGLFGWDWAAADVSGEYMRALVQGPSTDGDSFYDVFYNYWDTEMQNSYLESMGLTRDSWDNYWKEQVNTANVVFSDVINDAEGIFDGKFMSSVINRLITGGYDLDETSAVLNELQNNNSGLNQKISQYYEALTSGSDLASGLYEEIMSIFDAYITQFPELTNLFGTLISSINDPKTGLSGYSLPLKSASEILEEVQDGYNGITEAMANASAEGYITADSLSTLLKLEEENALAGLKLENILRRDANGYKIAGNALEIYSQALINQYAALESINTFQDRANVLTNLQNLYTILSTLANTGSKGDNGSDKLKEQLEEQKEALNNQVDAYKELIDLRKDLLESYVDELKYEKELAKKQEDVSRLQTKLTVARLDNSASGQARVRELEEELKEAEEDLEEFTLEHAVDEITENLDEQYEEYKRFIDKRVDEITEEISKIGKSSSGGSGIDTSWLKTMLKAIETAIKEVEKKVVEVGRWSEFSEFNIVIDIPATNPTVPVPEILQGKGKWISMYHTGGIVGDTHLGKNEEFAKLLKGEFVSTPAQMKRFMEKTLPQVAAYTSNEKSNEFNAPLISIECESINQDTLPGLKDVVDSAVEEIKKILDGGMSRVGHKRQARKLLI